MQHACRGVHRCVKFSCARTTGFPVVWDLRNADFARLRHCLSLPGVPVFRSCSYSVAGFPVREWFFLARTCCFNNPVIPVAQVNTGDPA